MKTYSEQIADILRNAPTVPPLRHALEPVPPGVSAETKAKLIMLHAAEATFGHQLDDTHYG